MEFKSKDVQEVFNRSQETVRKWADEFAQYLSESAKPGSGRHRLFTTDDLEVFALVADMKDKRIPPEDIHATLAAGQRGDLSQYEVKHSQTTETAIQLNLTERRLSELTTELSHTRAEIRQLHDENIRLQTSEDLARKRVLEMTSELERVRQHSQEKVDQLTREIGRLEAQLEMERQRNQDTE